MGTSVQRKRETGSAEERYRSALEAIARNPRRLSYRKAKLDLGLTLYEVLPELSTEVHFDIPLEF
jgi:hypothetical protein